jgi:hypothetical protein
MQRVPVLWDENDDKRKSVECIKFMRMFDMANDSGLFRDVHRLTELREPMPLYEPKFIHQYDHQYATFEGCGPTEIKNGSARETQITERKPNYRLVPRYWVDLSDIKRRSDEWLNGQRWVVSYRGVTNPTKHSHIHISSNTSSRRPAQSAVAEVWSWCLCHRTACGELEYHSF